MLVLSRRNGERIQVSSAITITVIDAKENKVRLGFSAPPEVQIYREEVSDRIQAECGPIQIQMIQKKGKCRHALGDVFEYSTLYRRPEGVCNELLHVLGLYAWRLALNAQTQKGPSARVLRIHCPSRTGTVWEIKMARTASQDGRQTDATDSPSGNGNGNGETAPRDS